MNNRNRKQPLVLIVLDGWGIAKPSKGNAISCAEPLFFNELAAKYPTRLLFASEEKVGLPRGVFGNSEVGHLNLGAGRVVFQDLLRINKSIKDKSFFNNAELKASVAHLKKTGGAWQVLGLVSNGCVHSSLGHLFALLSFAKKSGIKEVYVHAFLDGRDTPRDSGRHFIKALENEMTRLKVGKIATVSGRFYALDRDNHWERINKAYQAMVSGQGEIFSSAAEAIRASYKRKIYDEEILPAIIKETKSIKSGDAVIFFNYRADRAREITRALIDNKLKSKDLKKDPTIKNLYFVAFTGYEKNLGLHVAFPSKYLSNCLGEIISRAGLKQLRIAETEKYAHVTYFFNGGREAAFTGEDRLLIPSPRVDSYASQPEMSAKLICAKLLGELKKDIYDFVLVNFANADMVGHTGNIPAAARGIKTVDACLKRITDEILKRGGTVLVTADHGNADEMYDFKKKEIIKEHSLNPVPFIAVKKSLMIKKPNWIALDKLAPNGRLADVAPTVIKLLNLKKP
ncbi:MAG: 2,3-bisphosphoglycerate-independent phosphoglycerate mutase, partial [bacterium]|nr:2,3-bisphosphoglycerate-independent phosphoglycerate mutase [bacterium]